jgi:hypothetical protein
MKCPKCRAKVSHIPTDDGQYISTCENPSCDWERLPKPNTECFPEATTPAQEEIERSR